MDRIYFDSLTISPPMCTERLKLVHLAQIQWSGMISLPPRWILAGDSWNLQSFAPLKIFPLSLLSFLLQTLWLVRGLLWHLVEFWICALLATDSYARLSFLRVTVYALQQSFCTPCKWKIHAISSDLMRKNRLCHSLQQILMQYLSLANNYAHLVAVTLHSFQR